MRQTKVKVKICGVTRQEDALAAAEEGAEFIGFNFWPQSKRYCPPELAAEIRECLPASVHAVGIFVNADRGEVLRICEQVRLDALQLHGDETPEDCANFPRPVVKAFHVAPGIASRLAAFQKGTSAPANISAFLLDTAAPGYGGSGIPFPAELLQGVNLPRPLWLAGGLNPDNVREAISRFEPDVVDVATGVEASPGLKDRERMKAFLAVVKEVNRGNAA